MLIKQIFAAFFLLLAASSSVFCQEASDGGEAAAQQTEEAKEPLLLGMILPLTGDFSFFGYQASIGAAIAVHEINEQGGRPVRVLYEDDGCKAAGAVSAFRRLREEENVAAVIGPACTGSIMAVGAIAQKSRQPIVALLDAGEQVANVGDQVYSIGFDSEEEGRLVADYLTRNDLSEVAVIYEEDQWAQLVTESFKKQLAAGGGRVLVEQSHNPENKDYRSVITKVMEREPQALFVAPAYNGGYILNQLRELRVKVPIVGPDTFGSQAVLETAQRAAEGVVFANVRIDEDGATAKRLRKKISEDYGEDLDSLLFVALGYDSVRLVYAAMADSVDLHQALKQVRYRDGIIAVEGFDKNGMAKLNPQLMKVVKGEIVALKADK